MLLFNVITVASAKHNKVLSYCPRPLLSLWSYGSKCGSNHLYQALGLYQTGDQSVGLKTRPVQFATSWMEDAQLIIILIGEDTKE